MSKKPRNEEPEDNTGPAATSNSNVKVPATDTLGKTYFGLLAAWRTDFGQAIEKMAEHVNDDSFHLIPVIDVFGASEFTHDRIGLALEYTITDADEMEECGGDFRSYECGIEDLIDFAVKILCAEPDENPVESYPGNPSTKILRIQSSMIALIARGEVSKACKLGRIAGAILWIWRHLNEKGMLKPGFDKKFSPEKDRIKLLVSLAGCIKEKRLPSLKALRIRTFGETKDDGNFSRLLNGMKVKKYIPRETTGRDSPKLGSFHPIGPSKDREVGWDALAGHMKTIEGSNRKMDSVLIDAAPDIAPHASIKPSGDPLMAQCEIRRIRESLGSVYWLLLIRFGMSELETAQDLERFVGKLADIGLELK